MKIMNELILIILAFISSPSLNSADCVFREDAFNNIQYRCNGETGFLREDSFGTVTDSRSKIRWRKDSFGNIRSSEGITWRKDSFGNFVSSKGDRWRKDSFGNWTSNEDIFCREDSFGNLRCRE